MTERFTVRLDEDAAEWLEAEADARDRSKAWVIQQTVDAARGTDSVFTDADHTESVRTGAHLTNRLDELEERLAALEADRSAEPIAADAGNGDAAGSTDSAGGAEPTTRSAETADAVTGRTAAREFPDVDEPEADPDLKELLAEWHPGRDREERRERRALGQQVLEWFRETEGHVSATDVKDALYPDLAYADESADTWWRKLGRPPLQAAVDAGVAEYRDGHHDYRWIGENAEDPGNSEVYDPTEEF